jgi:hypothetical protein
LLRFVQTEGQIQRLREGLSEFSHRCRNLLNGMKLSFYFIRKTDTGSLPVWWDDVEERYRGIERLFETLQRLYRPMPLTTVRTCFGSLVRDRQKTWREWFRNAGRRLELTPPDAEDCGDFDPICLVMALDAFVNWRARAMRPGRLARFGWTTEEGHFLVSWEETPLVELRGPDRAGAEAAGAQPSTQAADALALPLLTRVMTAHLGSLRWSLEPTLRFELRWPLELAATLAATAPAPALAPASRT